MNSVKISSVWSKKRRVNTTLGQAFGCSPTHSGFVANINLFERKRICHTKAPFKKIIEKSQMITLVRFVSTMWISRLLYESKRTSIYINSSEWIFQLKCRAMVWWWHRLKCDVNNCCVIVYLLRIILAASILLLYFLCDGSGWMSNIIFSLKRC